MPIKKLERYFFMPIFIPIWEKDFDFKLAQGKFNSFIQQALMPTLDQAMESDEE